MARRKKNNIGRRHKNLEKKIQKLKRNALGRPRKRTVCISNALSSTPMSTLTTTETTPPQLYAMNETDSSPHSFPLVHVQEATPIQSNHDQPPIQEAPPPSPSPMVEVHQQVSADTLTVAADAAKSLLSRIIDNIQLPSNNWFTQCTDEDCKLYKIKDIDGSLKITHTILIKSDGSWSLNVHNSDVHVAPLFNNIPALLVEDTAQNLLNQVEKAKVCPAHPDKEFVEFVESRPDKLLLTLKKDTLAKLDSFAPVLMGETSYESTVRPKLCKILVEDGRCSSCVEARKLIQKQYIRWKKRQSTTQSKHTSSSSRTNLRFLDASLVKQRLQNVRKDLMSAKKKISRMEKKIATSIQSEGISVSPEFHADLKALVEELTTSNHQRSSFEKLFWEQPGSSKHLKLLQKI